MTTQLDPRGSPVKFARVALIGCGLIGTSLVRRMRRDGLVDSVVGCDTSPRVRNVVEALEIVDEAVADPGEAVAEADLVVLAVPMSAYDAIGRAMARELAPGTIVTDVGSVKRSAVQALTQHIPVGAHFIPGHPIAGTEYSGPEAGFAELFDGRYVLLTPLPGTESAALDRLTALWQACGAIVESMEPAHHDHVLGITSHLPHLIAYTIVGTAANLEEDLRQEVIKYSASGFRDFTRIAASDPIMWRDVFLANREAVLDIVQRFTEDLTAIQRAIRWEQGDVLEDLFRRTREIRRSVIDYRQAD